MIKEKGWKLFSQVLIILGFIIIIFNAIIYLFSLWFSWSWLSIIGLVMIIIGMRTRRIFKERKISASSKEKK